MKLLETYERGSLGVRRSFPRFAQAYVTLERPGKVREAGARILASSGEFLYAYVELGTSSWIATFARKNQWILVGAIEETVPDARAALPSGAPWDALAAPLQILKTRLARIRRYPDLETRVRQRGVPIPEELASADAVELGFSLAFLRRNEEAERHLSRALEDPALPERAAALAVRAELRLARGLPSAAEEDASALAALTAGTDQDGYGIPVAWFAMHARYLRALIGAQTDDLATWESILEDFAAVVADAHAAEEEKRPHRTTNDAGEIIAIDLGATVFLGTTIHPELTRVQRSTISRLKRAEIFRKRRAYETALRELEGLDDLPDDLLRATLFQALGREADAVNILMKRANDGSADAAKRLQEVRSAAALAFKAPTGRPEEIDVEDRVLHSKFGPGVVTDAVSVNGRNVRATVDFDDGVTRTLPTNVLVLAAATPEEGARPSASTSNFPGSGDAGDGGPTSRGATPTE
jgi:hypothetical protein